MSEYILEMRNIGKKFGQNTVLKDVTLNVKKGEIHALLGENGAGKSTLMNILFGMPVISETGGYTGELLLDGEKVQFASPQDAMAKGIGMVHQEFMLIPGFTITENIKLNREISKKNLLSRAFGESLESLDINAMNRDARDALDNVQMGIEEYALVAGLPVGYMQFVEIAREIDKRGVKLLVFDEPTAVLTESEAEQLGDVMRSIAASGTAIVFITHRLDEVMAVADSVTILRDGMLAATRRKDETTLVELAELMIGRSGESIVERTIRPVDESAPVAMSIRNLHVHMPGEKAKGIDLDVYEGEILGIGGLAGQGKVGIPNGIMGLYEASGDVTYMGKKLPLNAAAASLGQRLAMVSEDRRGVGLLLEESIEDNIVFNAMQINGEFQKPLLGDANKIRSNLLLMILTVLLAAGCLVFGFYGDSKWPDKAGAPVSQSQAADAIEEEDLLALSEDAEGGLLEISDSELLDAGGEETESAIDSSVPIVARISPLFLILGFLGIFALLYILLYPWVRPFTDRVQVKDVKAIREYANGMIKDLDIRCRGPMQHTGTLSGGNQQKVCVARALALKPRFLFVSEPTRGIDIGAKKLVLETLVNLNRELKMTIVMVSSELMELRSICDRIAVISSGKVVDILPADASNAEIGLAMGGIKAEKGGVIA